VKKLLVVLILIGCGLAGLAYWLNQSGARAVTPDIFTYAPVVRGPMVESISATGALHPRELLVVTSQVPGLIIDIPGEINAIVSEGDVLARLDARNLELKLQEARDGVKRPRTQSPRPRPASRPPAWRRNTSGILRKAVFGPR
jgi:HlyD family secretion protein